jgi:hypothetical protein
VEKPLGENQMARHRQDLLLIAQFQCSAPGKNFPALIPQRLRFYLGRWSDCDKMIPLPVESSRSPNEF